MNLVSTVSLPEPVTDWSENLCEPYYRNPNECYRNKDFPAKAHYLIIPVARKGGPNPEEQESDGAEFSKKPDDAGDPG